MTTPAAIRAERVSKTLGGLTVLDEVSLEVAPAEIHALVGLNGAGKTTLMRILLGMLAPDLGAAHLAGIPVPGAGPQLWSRVGQMLETPFAYPELTARENVYCSARLHGMGRDAARSAAARRPRSPPSARVRLERQARRRR